MQPLDDAEIRRLAQEILFRTAKYIESKDIILPESVKPQYIDGELCFELNIFSSRGSAMVYYEPQLAIEYITRFYDQQRLHDTEGVAPADDKEWREEALPQLVWAWWMTLLQTFIPEYQETTINLAQVAYTQTVAAMRAQIEEVCAREGGRMPDIKKIKETVELDLKLYKRGRKVRIQEFADQARKRVGPKLEYISAVHELLAPIWKEAKREFKKRKFTGKEKGWVKYIQGQFSETDLPLGIKELPIHLIVAMASKDRYTAEPSFIALKHAAEICGARPDEYSRRQLYALLGVSKKCFENGAPSEKVQPKSVSEAQNDSGEGVTRSGRKSQKTMQKSAP